MASHLQRRPGRALSTERAASEHVTDDPEVHPSYHIHTHLELTSASFVIVTVFCELYRFKPPIHTGRGFSLCQTPYKDSGVCSKASPTLPSTCH